MRLPDRSEGERRQALRRLRTKGPEAKRRAWERRIWSLYGLTAEDVARRWNAQGGRCPLCGVRLEEKVWVIDHLHIKGFRKLAPEQRTRLFRGLLDSWCNHRVLSMCERAGMDRVVNAVYYLGWSEAVPGTCS